MMFEQHLAHFRRYFEGLQAILLTLCMTYGW